MQSAALVFPHQLFEDHPVLRKNPEKVLLVHHSLFYGDAKHPIRFHEKKIAYHDSTMMAYANQLERSGTPVEVIGYDSSKCQIGAICKQLAKEGITQIVCAEPCDFLLEKRLRLAVDKHKLELEILPSPAFINSREENNAWRAGKKRWHMADFYKFQRVRLDILMDGAEPAGGKWSFDDANRKKLPVRQVPLLPKLSSTDYPTTHADAKRWLDEFLQHRFELFGTYEDAIEQGENWIYHSILTPMLNIGLLTPEYVVRQAIAYAQKHDTPINSVEGFIRQIIGWREFMRATYEDLGVQMRNGNHWQHNRSMPKAFYDANTGIDPVDDCIKRVNEHAYCHHIERLMVLGGFMFLCEIKPDDIYTWFMELFIDSYDWVMVPNVYAMSQHADGGLITTKPYFSGSNYVIKMSHYKKGEWSIVWDALFWRWIFKNKEALAGNHRWSMMCKNAERMDDAKREKHIEVAEAYLAGL